jgi:tRNA(His) 5'-end guanylyltransferase
MELIKALPRTALLPIVSITLTKSIYCLVDTSLKVNQNHYLITLFKGRVANLGTVCSSILSSIFQYFRSKIQISVFSLIYDRNTVFE